MVVEAERLDMAAAVGTARGRGRVGVIVPVGTTVAASGTQLGMLSMGLPVTGGTEVAALAPSAEASVVMEDWLKVDGRLE